MAALTPNLSLVAKPPAATSPNPLPSDSSANLSLGNVAGIQQQGITNRSLLPPQLQSPNGQKANAPGATTPSPTNTLQPKFAAPPPTQVSATKENLSAQGAPASPVLPAPPVTGVASPSTNPIPGVTPQQPSQANNAPGLGPVNFGGILGSLLGRASDTSQVDSANNALQKFQTGMGRQYAGIESEAIPLEFQQGREQALQRAAATEQSALAQNVQNALAARGQGLTALGTAAGYAQPQVTGYGQTTFNPLSAQFGSGQSNLDPQTVAAQLAQKILSHQMSYSDAEAALGYAGSAGKQFLNAAIYQQNPSANLNELQGQATAQQSNAATAGTAATGAAATGVAQSTQLYNQTNTAYTAADTQAKNVQNVLASTGLNSSSSTDFNTALNKLTGRLGSTKVAELTASVAELQNMYSQLLSVGGGTPSGNEQQALTVLNPNSSAAQINASIGQLQQAAYAKLSAQYQQLQTYTSALAGNGTHTTTPSTNEGAVKAGGFTFVKDSNGKWAPSQ